MNKAKEIIKRGVFTEIYKVKRCKGMTKRGLLAFCSPYNRGGRVTIDKKGNGVVEVWL